MFRAKPARACGPFPGTSSFSDGADKYRLEPCRAPTTKTPAPVPVHLDMALRSNRLNAMSSSLIKGLLAIALLAGGWVLILTGQNTSMGWRLIAGAVGVVLGVLFAAWSIAPRLLWRKNDLTLSHSPELSTLAFPPSSFPK